MWGDMGIADGLGGDGERGASRGDSKVCRRLEVECDGEDGMLLRGRECPRSDLSILLLRGCTPPDKGLVMANCPPEGDRECELILT